MSTLDDIERAVANLSGTEKARLLQSLVREMSGPFPGVESRPEVCGGDACIVRTRIPVWLLEQARRLGASDAELLRSYPTLLPSDLANAWAYVQANRESIDAQIRENEAA